MDKMSDKRELKESILADIKKSGYPLEIEIYKLLHKHQWTITPQYYYKDRIDSTERSIDYICGKTSTGEDGPYKKTVIRLAVECKNLNDKNWVLFSMEDTEISHIDFAMSNLQVMMPEEKSADLGNEKNKSIR